jgi:hypothetical protein
VQLDYFNAVVMRTTQNSPQKVIAARFICQTIAQETVASLQTRCRSKARLLVLLNHEYAGLVGIAPAGI